MRLVKADDDEKLAEATNFFWSFGPGKTISADSAVIFTDNNRELVKLTVADALSNLGVSSATIEGAPDVVMYGFKGTVTEKKTIMLKAVHPMVAMARKLLLPQEATFDNAGAFRVPANGF